MHILFGGLVRRVALPGSTSRGCSQLFLEPQRRIRVRVVRRDALVARSLVETHRIPKRFVRVQAHPGRAVITCPVLCGGDETGGNAPTTCPGLYPHVLEFRCVLVEEAYPDASNTFSGVFCDDVRAAHSIEVLRVRPDRVVRATALLGLCDPVGEVVVEQLGPAGQLPAMGACGHAQAVKSQLGHPFTLSRSRKVPYVGTLLDGRSPMSESFPELVAQALARPSQDTLTALLDALPAVDSSRIASEVDSAVHAVHDDTSLSHLVDTALALTDLTTLEGTDTPSRVRALVARAQHPDPEDDSAPHTAGVCVYGDLAAVVREALGVDSPIELACVAGAFPSGRASIEVKLADVRYALRQGATEIDMVIDRGAFSDARYLTVFEDVRRIVEVCRDAEHAVRVKAILETGELPGSDAVQQASWLAMLAGADMIKTSTGKIPRAATLPDVAIMLDAAWDFEQVTGRPIGVKAAGGIRSAQDAVHYLSLVQQKAGDAGLVPQRFRFGASSLVANLVDARHQLAAGADPFGE